MAANYDDVLQQLREAGLIVDSLQVGRMVRTKVEGDREKRGWYALHELRLDSGDDVLVGSFGQWRGTDNGAMKVELRKREITREQREALRKRLAEDRKRAERMRQDEADKAASIASRTWEKLSPEGDCEYLPRKGVPALGLRFSPGTGAAVVPMRDVAGKVHGLQILRGRPVPAGKLDKEYWPKGLSTKGHFHQIGVIVDGGIVLVAEGYATAATLHVATSLPVVVAFDAGNVKSVVAALHKRYRKARILICADDDIFGKCIGCKGRVVLTQHPADCPHCGSPHACSNAGVAAASAAALEVGGAWIVPEFLDQVARVAAYVDNGRKLTDFNDMAAERGDVAQLLQTHITALGWRDRKPASASTTTSGGGGAEKLRPIEHVYQLLERYSLVYAHSGAVFDAQEHILMSLSDMRDACTSKDIHRAWSESPERNIVRISEVGFDPTERDASISCNLFGGWPTKPQAGKCEALLELLWSMCTNEGDASGLYSWVLKWIAYPIQHPGAKMKATVVVHGPQGTGKNLFFETVMAIYGEYGDVIDQSAVEDKFNDWASRKLFMIADEVVARSDLYHIKNKLKALITGERIRINPKNFAAYWERNHLNLVFLSNEAMPVVIEEDDRRHCIIWTPPAKSPEFYTRVAAEIANGGAAALHDYLLHLDLGDFTPDTKPPMTAAKGELISLGLDSPLRFYDELMCHDIPGLDPMPGLATDWYAAYKTWCQNNGVRPAPGPKFSNALNRKRGVSNPRKVYRPGDKRRGPHGFLMIGDTTPPADKTEMDWLGWCFGRCKEQIDEYRGVLK